MIRAGVVVAAMRSPASIRVFSEDLQTTELIERLISSNDIYQG